MVADEQGHGAVGVLFVDSLPVSHHTEEPTVEALALLFGLDTLHAVGHGSDTVFAIPLAETIRILFHRVVGRHPIRFYIALDLRVLCWQPFVLCMEADAVHGPRGDGAEVKMERFQLPILHRALHGVVPELVASLHELVQPGYERHGGGDTGFAAERPFQCIHIAEVGAYLYFVAHQVTV